MKLSHKFKNKMVEEIRLFAKNITSHCQTIVRPYDMFLEIKILEHIS